MFVDLGNIFNYEGSRFAFDYEFLMESLMPKEIENPFVKPVWAKGEFVNRAGVVSLKVFVNTAYVGVCDRCLCETQKDLSLNIEHLLIFNANDMDNDEYIVVDDFHFNLDELIYEDVWLNMPLNTLCCDDCKGLCSQCGANLNVNECNCKKQIDPRLEVLEKLLNYDS